MPVWDYLQPVREARDFERIPPQVDDPERLFVLGGPNRWRVSPVGPWGQWHNAVEGRAMLKATQGDGNFLTNAINLLGGAVGFEPNAVPLEDQLVSNRLLEANLDIPFSLAQKDIRPFYRERVDPNFDSVNEIKGWREDNPKLASILDLKMPGLEDALMNVNNQEWFKYVINLSLSRIQAEQKIEERNNRIGTFRWLGEAGVDGFVNYLLRDPTLAPSFLFFAGTKALQAGSVAFADDILRLGAKGGQVAGLSSRAAASTVRYIGSAPALVHGGLAARVGHATALGVELGAYGAALDTAAQLDMMRVWNSVFEGTDAERTFSYNELFLMSGLMGSLGFGLGGAIGGFRPSRVRQMREGLVAATNGDINSRAARRGFSDPASAPIMQTEDMARVSVLNKLERLSPSTEANANDLHWLMDSRVLEEHGVLPFQVDDVLDDLLDLLGEGTITKRTLTEFMIDWLVEAGVHNRAERFVIPTDGPGAIRWRQIRHGAEEELVREGQLGVGSKAWQREVHRRSAERYIQDIEELSNIPKGRSTSAAIANLQEESRELLRLQRTRGLSTDEEAKFITIERELTSLDSVPVAIRREVIEGRGADELSEFLLRDFQPTTARTKAVARLAKLRTSVREISEEITKLKKSRGIALPRIARLEIRLKSKRTQARRVLADLADLDDFTSGQSMTEIMAEEALRPLVSRQDRIDAIVARKAAADVGGSQFVTDIHATATMMRAWGLGETVATIALHKTGQPLTTRSLFAAVREASHFVDNSKITVDTLGPQGPIHAGTLMDAKRNAEKMLAPLNGYIQSLFETKAISSTRQWKDWQRQAVLHAHNLVESEDVTVQKAVALWKQIADDIAKEGGSNGRLEAKIVEDFFPVRILVGKLRRNAIQFQAALVENWTRRWLQAEELNPEILAAMQLADRRVSDRGTVRYVPTGDFAGLDRLPQRRNELTDELNTAYEATIKGERFLNERGESALQVSAWRAINGMLDQKTFDQGKDGIMRFHEPVPKTAEFQRAIDPELILDTELEGFFDFNFMDVAYDYIRTTGFEVKAQTAVQRLTGVVGSSVDEYFDAMQIVAEKGLRRGTRDSKLIGDGFQQLRTKWNLMRGRTPRYVAEAEGLGEAFAEAAVAGTTAVYGGGIGTLITFTELFIQSFARLYDMNEFFNNMATLFRTIMLDKRGRNEALQDMAVSLRLNRMTSAERFTSGAQGSNFHYRLRDKLSEPYVDFWDAATGTTAPGGRLKNRFASTTVSGIKAIGKTMLTLGGTDFFTNNARIMLTHTATRETARFLPAALKMAKVLEARAGELKSVNQVARQTALDAGKGIDEAIRRGNTAQFKLWQRMARESGFGRHWQVADRFARHGMMNSRKLEKFIEVGQASGALGKKKGLHALDLTEMASQLGQLDAADRFLVGEMIDQVDNSIEDVMRKRVSEQGPLQTPTDVASLAYHGRVLNAMFSFSRSFVDNNIIDLAHLPQFEGMALLTGFIVGETMGQVARQLLKGRSIDDLQREWQENPEAAMASYILRVPLLGQATPILQTFADAALDGKRYKATAGQSAATSLQSQLLNMASDAVAAPAELLRGEKPRIITGLDRLSVTMLPGLGAFRRAMGDDSLDRVPGGVAQSHTKYRQAADYTKFREKVAGQPEFREDPNNLFDIDDLIEQLEEGR